MTCDENAILAQEDATTSNNIASQWRPVTANLLVSGAKSIQVDDFEAS